MAAGLGKGYASEQVVSKTRMSDTIDNSLDIPVSPQGKSVGLRKAGLLEDGDGEGVFRCDGDEIEWERRDSAGLAHLQEIGWEMSGCTTCG